MVGSVIVDYADAVLVEPVVKFLVNGVEVHDCGWGKADGELKEEVWVAENGFVEVERLVTVVRLVWKLQAPNGSCDVVATVAVAADDPGRCA